MPITIQPVTKEAYKVQKTRQIAAQIKAIAGQIRRERTDGVPANPAMGFPALTATELNEALEAAGLKDLLDAHLTPLE